MNCQARSRKQLNAEMTDRQCEQSKANHGDADACQHGEPEPKPREEERKRQEHGKSRHHVPERVPGVVGNLGLRLLLDVKPDERKECDQRKRGNKSPELVTALCRLRHDDHNGGGE